MKNINNINVFYSRGPHFVRALKHVRTLYPHARITAMIPPRFPLEFLEGLCDEIVITIDHGDSKPRWQTIRDIIGQIRSIKPDMFIVLFDSPRLRLLAAASGARQRFCYTLDGQFRPIRLSLGSGLLQTAYRRIRGEITYAYVHYIVYHYPVKKEPR